MPAIPQKAERTGEVRSLNPTVRVSETEMARIRAAAAARGYDRPTEFMRVAVLAAVAEIESESTKPAPRRAKGSR
jgi:hypothetical protein